MTESVLLAISEVFSIEVIGYIAFGLFIGYVVGVLPGLNKATAIAISIPFTIAMSPLVAISFLIGISKGGATGSAVTAILINVPGEPSSVVTTLDGFPLTKQGKSQKALKIALIASVLGDLLATIVLIALAAPLARIALATGPIELIAILIFAITFIAAVSGRSFYKGLIAGLLGLFLAVPGLDAETGLPRLTFGFIQFFDGIPLLAVAIGTLALSEILVQVDEGWRGDYVHRLEERSAADPADRRLSRAELAQCGPTIISSSVIGVGVGILPGLGSSLSSFLAYTVARRRSKRPEEFGRGAIEGVAAAEAADNASVPASLIPLFAIGVPGSISTALLMGAFMLHGLTPGPYLFRDDAVLVYGIYTGMMVASVLMLLIGYVGQTFFSRLVTLPDTIILPVVAFLCVIAAYMEGGGMFSVYLMLAFGFFGYFMKKFDFSFVTFLIGFILGPMVELTLRQSIIISNGNPAVLLEHPVAIVFLLLAVIAAWRFSSWHFLEQSAGQKASLPEKTRQP